VREIRFKRHPAVGGSTFPWERGTVADLLLEILVSDRVPPLAVVNDLLSRGEMSRGMSGGASWKPFCLDRVEYEEVVEELLTRPGSTFALAPALETCATYEDFERASLDV
jgi:hypothetical protein